jgi:glycosyltransferase involved in cell wall biosynthesis
MSSSSSKILLISYQFPPAGGVAVQRILSLAKYLPPAGFDVRVLCCSNPGVPVQDPKLLLHVPASVEVDRVMSPEPPFHLRRRLWDALKLFRGGRSASNGKPAAGGRAESSPGLIQSAVQRVLSPDPEVVWVPFARRRARQLIRKHDIRHVLITAPPYSSYLIGIRLKAEMPWLNIVSDYRDDWLGYYVIEYDYYRSAFMRKRATEIERKMVESSNLVVCVTRTITRAMQERYPDQPPSKFAWVANGYDPESFANLQPRPHGTSKIVVTYTGTLHKASTARHYLDALDSLPGHVQERFETRFIGRITTDEAGHLRNRKSAIVEIGFLPQKDVFGRLEDTDFLLVTMMHAGSMTGKVFEYLATGRPILAFAAPGSELARVIEETGAGWCADPEDPDGMRRMLLHAVDVRDGREPGPVRSQAAVERYDRSRLAAEYGDFIRTAAARAGRP